MNEGRRTRQGRIWGRDEGEKEEERETRPGVLVSSE